MLFNKSGPAGRMLPTPVLKQHYLNVIRCAHLVTKEICTVETLFILFHTKTTIMTKLPLLLVYKFMFVNDQHSNYV